MKSISPKKLLKYSAAASGFLALSPTAHADIVYTDVSPDVLLYRDFLDIDLNSDGVSDVRIIHTRFTSSSGSGPYSNWKYTYFTARAQGMGGAELLKSGTTPFNGGAFGGLLGALSDGVSIGPADVFSSKGVMAYSFYYRWWAFSSYFVSSTRAGIGGDWDGVSDRYMGIKFQIAGADHYGWIRCDVSSGATNIRVKSFAYEDVPGTPITAGDVGTIACDATVAPAGLSTIAGASSVTFNWTPVAGSIGCRLSAGPVGGGFPYTRDLIGADLGTSGPIPFGSLPPNTYEAKVQCACEITPALMATPFSNTVLFNVPAPRLADEALATSLQPNPASDNIVLEYRTEQEERVDFYITNIAGQQIFAETAVMFAGKQHISFDISNFNSGVYLMYIVSGKNSIVEKFEVSK